MKPETTWEDKLEECRASDVDGMTAGIWQELLETFREILSSSQALAHRSGIEEAMSVVKDMKPSVWKMIVIEHYDVLKKVEARNDVLKEVIQALQEMVDTKGE